MSGLFYGDFSVDANFAWSAGATWEFRRSVKDAAMASTHGCMNVEGINTARHCGTEYKKHAMSPYEALSLSWDYEMIRIRQ